ncbi:MAG: DUF1475 family protein [Parvularculaceae bacterium]
MTVIRIILAIGAIALTGAIFWAFGADGRPLGEVLGALLPEPWFVVSMIDLYLGFFIGAVVIVLFERNKILALAWAAPIFVLGNVVTAAWFVWRAPEIARRLRADGSLIQ